MLNTLVKDLNKKAKKHFYLNYPTALYDSEDKRLNAHSGLGIQGVMSGSTLQVKLSTHLNINHRKDPSFKPVCFRICLSPVL